MTGKFRDGFDVSIGVGDLLEVSDDESEKANLNSNVKKKAAGLPELDGEESLAEFISKRKKACLAKRQLFRDALDHLQNDGAVGHEQLVQSCSLHFPIGAHFLHES